MVHQRCQKPVRRMHLLDVTMFYCARSGGVKRYLLSKREWLGRNAASVKHSILVPAPHRAAENIQTSDGWALALGDGYRLPLDLKRWQDRIEGLAPDLIEAADPYVPGWAARRIADRHHLPALAFYHSDMPRLLAARVGAWIRPAARRYLRSFYSGFDLVLAPSRVMIDHLHASGVEHVELQPLGVDVATFSPHARDAELRRKLSLPSDARLLVYAGRFALEKNLNVLKDAVRRLGDPFHLLLIGGHRRERLEHRVTVLPYQRNTQRLARLLASCDLFVHAGDQETYGLVAAEAMACGLPVVAVDSGALPEIVDEGVGALARTVSAEALAQAIEFTFTRDLGRLRQSARARAELRYSWDRVFNTMLSRYAGLVSGTAPFGGEVAASRG